MAFYLGKEMLGSVAVLAFASTGLLFHGLRDYFRSQALGGWQGLSWHRYSVGRTGIFLHIRAKVGCGGVKKCSGTDAMPKTETKPKISTGSSKEPEKHLG